MNGYRISSPELIGHFRVPILRASSPFGDILKSRRASGTLEETRKRRAGASSRLWRSLARSRAACFARLNRRACSQTTESQKPSFSKWGQEYNLSCENEFNWPKNIKSFPSKAEHLSSFWYRGPVELANGLFKTPFMERLACLTFTLITVIRIVSLFVLLLSWLLEIACFYSVYSVPNFAKKSWLMPHRTVSILNMVMELILLQYCWLVHFIFCIKVLFACWHILPILCMYLFCLNRTLSIDRYCLWHSNNPSTITRKKLFRSVIAFD